MSKHRIRPWRGLLTLAATIFGLGSGLSLPALAGEEAPTYWIVSGDWDGDRVDTPAWVDLATWRLDTQAPTLGEPVHEAFATLPWIPVAGDWDGDGRDTVLMFSPETWRVLPLDEGPVTVADPEPNPWLPVAGDWDGDGRDTLLVTDAWTRDVYKLGDPPSAGSVDPKRASWHPLAVDPDGAGRDTLDWSSLPPAWPPGPCYPPDPCYPPGPCFPPGPCKVVVLSGDWDGDGRTSEAVFDGALRMRVEMSR